MTKASIAICFLVATHCAITASGQTGQSGAAKLIGKVIERETFQTLAAEIAIAGRDNHDLFLRHTRSSTDGLFEISDLPAGELHLTTKLNGFATDHMSVSLNKGETRYIEFYLTRGKTVRGIVSDQANRPIAGARVKVAYAREATADSSIAASYEWEKGDTVTDQSGQFELKDLHPEQEFVIEASHPKFSAAVTKPLQIMPQDRDLSVNLSLGIGLSLTGVVRDADGNLLRGARLMLFAENTLEARTQTITNNDDGTFTFDQVDPSKKTLVVVHPSYRPYRQIIDFANQRTRLSIDVVLQQKK
jgi:carboxypeptidase family protein